MEMIRTIHPIGQGAFYSERFIDERGNVVATMVYDCGSNNKTNLYSEINSYFDIPDFIDILFISHFDKDHVNGVEKLLKNKIKIKTIVIPLINSCDQWFYVNEFGFHKNFQDALVTYFQADKVIQVAPNFENQEPLRDVVEPIAVESVENNILHGGTPITSQILKDHGVKWFYVPYNFESVTRIEKLKEELSGLNLSEEDLYDPVFIKTNWKRIKVTYENICRNGSNLSSLIVFSGSNYFTKRHVNPICCNYFRSFHYYHHKFGEKGYYGGSIYLGDTDLNQTNCNNRTLLYSLQKSLGQWAERVLTIQLPHHGSRLNFNSDLFKLFKNCNMFFASFGKNNNYGHPSFMVIEFIIHNNALIFGVTEDRTSCIQEYVIF